MLEQFHILTLQSKISAYDYYLSLQKLTENVGLQRNFVCVSLCCIIFDGSYLRRTALNPSTVACASGGILRC